MELIKYREGYKYQLSETYTVNVKLGHIGECSIDGYILLVNDTLTISKGYAWDGASGPAIDTANIMRGALVHDALYQLMRASVLDISFFHAVNNVLHDICIEEGMSWFRAWYILKAVERFGMTNALPGLNT